MTGGTSPISLRDRRERDDTRKDREGLGGAFFWELDGDKADRDTVGGEPIRAVDRPVRVRG
ncbi:hypothetical protein NGM37_11030, partial [Streptomyces sp. TRM76130]|nr:hypothetical protein [Streptomyces sp. TRM76130]